MAINFPNNPAVNDTFTVGGTTFTFTGVKWETSAVVEISSDTTPTLGGDLDAATYNINNVGIITATTFSGSLTGNVTGTATNAQGLTGDPSIQVTNATVLGNLDVQGTTTTIDTAVTSVDSLAVDGNVGIGTTNATSILDVRNGIIVKDQDTSQNAANPGLQLKHNGTIYGSWRHDGRLEIGGQDANATIRLNPNGTVGINSTIPTSQLDVGGTISDSVGPLRRLGINYHNAATYTLVASDAGKLIREATNSANITIPQNVFAAGDMISIFNVSGGDNTITEGTGATLYNTADGATGNRTLGSKGVCTILCTSTNEFIISGSQVS